ncbi:unnamed protein product [Ceutorhynchus assimilis]|uniref:Uncharacterized protein n=1 Tax=Ceutorhynchus assimilis TaxID=467358 RepID=A0A9N9QB58_9CUCU|nr:unnamed protein product [Ceutorhynchus assimilis]
MDEETGESDYKFQISKNAETGEEEYVTYCLDEETGEKLYCTIDKICESFQMPNPFKITRYATHLTAIVRHRNDKSKKSSERRMEFMTAIVFLIPTFIIFTPLLGVIILTFDFILHRWCHRQNAKLRHRNDSSIFYQSPLHMINKEFCSKCLYEEDGKKIHAIQNIRYNRKHMVKESLRRAVA